MIGVMLGGKTMSRRTEKQKVTRDYELSLEEEKKDRMLQEKLQEKEEDDYWESKNQYERYIHEKRQKETLERMCLSFNS